MLDKCALFDELLESGAGNEEILLSVNLARAWGSRCVCDGFSGQLVATPMRFNSYIRETLKPNLSGNSVKRRWSRVLFPTPEGPESTSGRKKSGKGGMAAICFRNLCDEEELKLLEIKGATPGDSVTSA